MFIKKLLAVALALSLAVTFSACAYKTSNSNDTDKETKAFQVSDYPIWITTPDNWEKQKKDNLDLQYMAPQGDIFLSMYVYYAIDLAEDQSGQSLFEIQNESLLSLRENVSEIEPTSSNENEEKIVYSSLYSAELDGSKNYYNFYLIEFKNTGDMAWILFSGIPSSIEKNRDTISQIISNVYNHDPGI